MIPVMESKYPYINMKKNLAYFEYRNGCIDAASPDKKSSETKRYVCLTIPFFDNGLVKVVAVDYDKYNSDSIASDCDPDVLIWYPKDEDNLSDLYKYIELNPVANRVRRFNH